MTSPPVMIIATLYSKPDCGLCAPFFDIVTRVLSKPKWRNFYRLDTVNIDGDAEAFAQYHEKIPALEINGRLAFKYFVTEEELEERLALTSQRTNPT